MNKGFMFGGAFLPEKILKNFPKKDTVTQEAKAALKTYNEIKEKYGARLARTWFEQENPGLICRLEQDALNDTPAPLYITRVLYNYPTTVVFWSDNTKTSVKCSEVDAYCKEAGLSMCVLKKLVGSAAFKDLLDDWTPEQYYDNLTDENAEVLMKDVRYKHNHMD